MVCDSAFNQMMQLMFGFCRNSSCDSQSVRANDKEANYETMVSAFTMMCPSLNLNLNDEEMRAYGVNLGSVNQCPGATKCTNAHEDTDLRRKLFLNNGQIAYWPVLCSNRSGQCPQGEWC